MGMLFCLNSAHRQTALNNPLFLSGLPSAIMRFMHEVIFFPFSFLFFFLMGLSEDLQLSHTSKHSALKQADLWSTRCPTGTLSRTGHPQPSFVRIGTLLPPLCQSIPKWENPVPFLIGGAVSRRAALPLNPGHSCSVAGVQQHVEYFYLQVSLMHTKTEIDTVRRFVFLAPALLSFKDNSLFNFFFSPYMVFVSCVQLQWKFRAKNKEDTHGNGSSCSFPPVWCLLRSPPEEIGSWRGLAAVLAHGVVL